MSERQRDRNEALELKLKNLSMQIKHVNKQIQTYCRNTDTGNMQNVCIQ